MATTEEEQGASILAELHLDLGRVEGRMSRMEKKLSRPPQQPFFGRRAASGAFTTAAAVLWLDLGGPTQGFSWYLRTLVVGGMTPATTAVGIADLYVTPAAPATVSVAAMGLTEWRDRLPTLPNIDSFGRGEIPLRNPERLWVAVTAATNNQSYVAAAVVEVLEDAALPRGWAE